MLRPTTSLTAAALLVTAVLVGCDRSDVDTVDTGGQSRTAEAAPDPSSLEAIAHNDPDAHSDSYPFDFSLTSTEGTTVAKEDFAGRVMIVDIWATWCPPCRAEVPHFVELQEEYEDQGLSVIGINYEGGSEEEAIEAIADFTDDIPVNYPLLIGDEATQSQIPNFNAFPTTLFIDRDGQVRLTVIGARPKAELEAIVKILLDESA